MCVCVCVGGGASADAIVKAVNTSVVSVKTTLPLPTVIVVVAAVVAVVVWVSKSPGSIEPIADAAVVELVLLLVMMFVHPGKLPSPKVAAVGRSLTN